MQINARLAENFRFTPMSLTQSFAQSAINGLKVDADSFGGCIVSSVGIDQNVLYLNQRRKMIIKKMSETTAQ